MTRYRSNVRHWTIMLALLPTALIAPQIRAESMTLTELVNQVKVALLTVQQESDDENLPPLQKAVLEMQAIQKVEGGGKISFFIVEFGADISDQFTSTVKLTLTPPSPESGSNVASATIAEALAQSILAGARAIEAAKKG